MKKLIISLLAFVITILGYSQKRAPSTDAVKDFTVTYIFKCEYENNQNLKAFAYYIGNQAGYRVENISDLKGAMAQSDFREALFAKFAEQSNYESDMLSANLLQIGMKAIYAKALAQYILSKYKRYTANKNPSNKADENKSFAGENKGMAKFDAHRQKKTGVSFKEPSKQKRAKAVFKGVNEYDLDDISWFTGTKMFCDGMELWYYKVTVKNDSITLFSYPGKENVHPLEKIYGHIEGNKIITNDPPEYKAPRFKYENGILYELNNEGGYNYFKECE
jgi:hypothetical protein